MKNYQFWIFLKKRHKKDFFWSWILVQEVHPECKQAENPEYSPKPPGGNLNGWWSSTQNQILETAKKSIIKNTKKDWASLILKLGPIFRKTRRDTQLPKLSGYGQCLTSHPSIAHMWPVVPYVLLGMIKWWSWVRARLDWGSWLGEGGTDG